MKKEIVSLTLLLLLLAGSLINIHINGKLIGELKNEVSRAYESAVKCDFEAASSQLSDAAEHWLSLDGYTHIFIRHSEIDSTTDAFFELESDIASEDAESAKGSYDKLMAHLDSLMTMEQISLGSIF